MSTTPSESKPKKKKSKRKKKFWNSEKILSLSAIFMSAATLLVLLYQTNIMRKQQAMSVYPYLEMMGHGFPSPDYRYSLTNNGVGPALIKKVKIHHKGKVHEGDIANYIRKIIPSKIKDSLDYSYTNISNGHLIPPNSTINIIELKNGGSNEARKLDSFVRGGDINYEIEYESIYGERWVVSKNNSVPRKLE